MRLPVYKIKKTSVFVISYYISSRLRKPLSIYIRKETLCIIEGHTKPVAGVIRSEYQTLVYSLAKTWYTTCIRMCCHDVTASFYFDNFRIRYTPQSISNRMLLRNIEHNLNAIKICLYSLVPFYPSNNHLCFLFVVCYIVNTSTILKQFQNSTTYNFD